MPESTIVVVVKGIIQYNKKTLIIKRALTDEFGGGTWEFTGGKIDFGEALETALQREVKEEVGLEVTVKDLLYATEFETHPHRQLVILCYLCEAQTERVTLSEEHSDYLWADETQMREMLVSGIVADLDKYQIWGKL